MKSGPDPPRADSSQHATDESSALAQWYDAHPTIQRLWGIRDTQTLRVVVSIEPTLDGDDTYPAWVANWRTWARELRSLTGRTVQLELVGPSALDGIEIHADSVTIADLSWRDATLLPTRSANTEVKT